MAWSMALSLIATALSGTPAQVAPTPTLAPVVVTVPDSTPTTPTPTDLPAVTVPTTQTLTESPLTVPPGRTDVSGFGETTTPDPAAPPRADDPARSSTPSRLGSADSSEQRGEPGPSPRNNGADVGPATSRPATRLAVAARDAAGDFAAAEALALLVGLFLAADGATRRRGDLAHVQLDDRDATVRFE